MSTDAPPRAELLFYEALELAPGEREGFLNDACGADVSLRVEVDELLMAHDGAADFLQVDAPASPKLEAEFARLKPEEAGERIGNYKLLEQIGEGGFGVVWVAEQEKPVRRRVALKIIKLGMDTRDVIARFEQERQALAMMDHPNIAKVLDAGATPFGRPFFAMELVRGIKITEYCDQANLPTAERLQLFIAVCHAVQHAHQKGIIHRDLKPSNILVTLHDGVPVPKVIDFGVAKATQQQRLTDLTVYTQFEQMIGTPLYMSPEQAEMSGLDIDTRSDIYSLGVLLYELLVGRTPFDPQELMKAGFDEMRRVIREEEPQKPSTFLSTMALDLRTSSARRRQTDSAKWIGQIRGDLDWIVMKALEKDRARRYETANGFAHDIQRHLLSEPVQARPPTQLYRFRRFAKRNKVAFAAASAVLAALIIGLGISTWMFFKEKQARERAVAAEKAQSQVAQFLEDMLKGVGPSVALGRDTKMLREILDKTAERVAKDLKDQPDVEAQLRKTLGGVYLELGDYEKAGAMHGEALAMRKKLLGNEHPAVAESLNDLATVLLDQGKLAEAETMHREALAMRRKLLGNEHSDVAESLNNSARVLHSEGKLAEAETMHREALAMKRKLSGNEGPHVAGSLNDLASVLYDQGKLVEAETMFREGLAMSRKLVGNEHPDVANSLNNLAVVLRKQGKPVEAETTYREALAMDRKLVGNEHPDVANSLNNLAVVLRIQGKLDEAETMHREALAMQRKLLGKEHPDVAISLDNLAKMLHAQGKVDEAETLQREALAMRRKLLGSDHPNVALSLSNLANTMQTTSRLDEAETFYRDVLVIRRKVLGNEHPDVAETLDRLGSMLGEQGRLAEAEILLREAVALERKVLGHEPLDLAESLNNLASVLESQRKMLEAETMHREALAIVRRSATNQPSRLEAGTAGLAENLYRQSKYAEAEPLYREILRSRRARLPAEDNEVLFSLASLARLLTDWVWAERGSKSETRNPSRAERDSLPEAARRGSAAAESKSEIAERAQEAERLLRDCLAIRLRGTNATHWRTDDVRSRLGGTLLAVAVTEPNLGSEARLSKFAEAESLLLEGNEGLQRITQPGGKKYQRDAVTRLIRLYETWGKTDKVADWQQKLADFDKAEAKKTEPEEKAVSPQP